MLGLPFITLATVGGFVILMVLLLAAWGLRFREVA